jgi:hypothetical protein
MFVTVHYFNVAKNILLELKGGGGERGERSLGLFYCLILSGLIECRDQGEDWPPEKDL